MNVILVSHQMKINNLRKLLRDLEAERDNLQTIFDVFESPEEERIETTRKYNERIQLISNELQEELQKEL